MDRVFLDANVLFSAAYLPSSPLLRLWNLKNVVLCSSRYALAEADFNLDSERQRRQLRFLAQKLQFYEAPLLRLPRGISLPEKDVPILLAAIEGKANYLLTGDLRHFGQYLGRDIAGVTILLPGEYLRLRDT